MFLAISHHKIFHQFIDLLLIEQWGLKLASQGQLQTYPTTKYQMNYRGRGGEWGKLPVPGRPTYLDNSRARAYCTYSRCGSGMF